MRTMIVLLLVLTPLSAVAQPAAGSEPGPGSGSAAAGSAAAGSAAAGSAAAGSATTGSAGSEPATPDTGTAPEVPAAMAAGAAASRTPAELREICAAAMNADDTFASDIVKSINEDTFRQHARAAAAVAKNEKHVILAYAAMWVLAALFVLFLWRRQQGLKTEIAQLRRDLDAAAK